MEFRYIVRSLAVLALAAASTTAIVATAAEEHHHGTQAAHALAPGERWPTDAALREGMERIRGSIEPRLARVHAGQATASDYREIAGTVDTQVAYIVSNCKLPPDADAALHVTIAQMLEGADAMAARSKTSPRQGAVKVVAALERYGREFDHPGWAPLRR